MTELELSESQVWARFTPTLKLLLCRAAERAGSLHIGLTSIRETINDEYSRLHQPEAATVQTRSTSVFRATYQHTDLLFTAPSFEEAARLAGTKVLGWGSIRRMRLEGDLYPIGTGRTHC